MPPTATPRVSRTRARSGSHRARRERAASGLFGGKGGDDVVCATIHEAVLDHRLPPGTKLKEIALA
ncbi:MAG TPA: GntR family transcriptional regulator, partial [Casimicrobiaceae bacterium]|nr:GntR family transcriptional regulator [Casimicrobiaceae bacterium]